MTAFDKARYRRLVDLHNGGRLIGPDDMAWLLAELACVVGRHDDAAAERDALAATVRVLADAGAFAAAELERTRAENADLRQQAAIATAAANLVCADRTRLAALLADHRRVAAEFRAAWDDYSRHGSASQPAQVRYDAAFSAVLGLAAAGAAASGEGAGTA